MSVDGSDVIAVLQQVAPQLLTTRGSALQIVVLTAQVLDQSELVNPKLRQRSLDALADTRKKHKAREASKNHAQSNVSFAALRPGWS